MLRLNKKSEVVTESIATEFQYKMTITNPAATLWGNLSSVVNFSSEVLYTSTRSSIVSFPHGKHIVRFDSDTKAVLLDSSIRDDNSVTVVVLSHDRQTCLDFIKLLYELNDEITCRYFENEPSTTSTLQHELLTSHC